MVEAEELEALAIEVEEFEVVVIVENNGGLENQIIKNWETIKDYKQIEDFKLRKLQLNKMKKGQPFYDTISKEIHGGSSCKIGSSQATMVEVVYWKNYIKRKTKIAFTEMNCSTQKCLQGVYTW